MHTKYELYAKIARDRRRDWVSRSIAVRRMCARVGGWRCVCGDRWTWLVG